MSYLEIDGVPACRSRIVKAVEMTALDIGSAYSVRCGHETHEAASAAAAELHRLVGKLGVTITVRAGSCPEYEREIQRDQAAAN